MKLFQKLFFILVSVVLSGCATKNPLTDFQFQTVTVPPYVLATWYKISNPGGVLRIYIEGDGHSFDAYNMPTSNPTPRSTFLREIAASDPNENVVYLARPCQYLQTSTCSQTDWTDGRFSPQVVDSMSNSVLAVMKKAQTDKAILIGYSGGAQIAGLVAVRYPNKIKKLITIAGVLDQKAWSDYHGDTPLLRSLNLKDYQNIYETIPQVHFVGSKDKVVPNELTYQFVSDESKIVVVEGADHQNGFKRVIDKIYHQN